jgi:hypothetical protein
MNGPDTRMNDRSIRGLVVVSAVVALFMASLAAQRGGGAQPRPDNIVTKERG